MYCLVNAFLEFSCQLFQKEFNPTKLNSYFPSLNCKKGITLRKHLDIPNIKQ